MFRLSPTRVRGWTRPEIRPAAAGHLPPEGRRSRDGFCRWQGRRPGPCGSSRKSRKRPACKRGKRCERGQPRRNSAGEAEERLVGGEPVAANAAYGLEPLDAATAGLGRARRLRMLQLGVLALGIVALIAGITLIVTGLAH